METREQLLLYLQKLMDQSRLGTGPTASTADHDRGQEGDPQMSSEFQESPDLPGRVDSAIPDLDDLERRILRSTHKTIKSKESSGPHPVIPEVPQPKGEPQELPAAQGFSSNGSLLRRGSAFQHLARDSQAEILSRTAPGSVCKILVDNIGVSLWLRWSNLATFSIVMMNLCYLVLTVTLYIFGLQLAGEQWTALSLLLFSIVAILLLQLVKRSLRSADLNMALLKLDFCSDSIIFKHLLCSIHSCM